MTVRKGVSLFLLLVFLVSAAVLYSSYDATSFELIWKGDPLWLLLALLLVVLVWVFDALKFQSLVCAAGERVPFSLAIQLTWLNYFGCAITPMQGGGGPLQMYMMYKNGISVGKSFAITLVRTLLTMLILGVMVGGAFIFNAGDLPTGTLGMRTLIVYVIVAITVVWCAVALSILRPRIIKRFLGVTLAWLNKIGFLKKEKVASYFRYTAREVDAYNRNVRLFFTSGSSCFLLAILLAFLQTLAQFSVMPCLVRALNYPIPYFQSVLLQALLVFLLYFVPTPGGSGVAEGGAAMLFKLFVPWSLVGMLAVAWRFILEYTGVLLGAVVAVHFFGWNLSDAMKDATRKTIEEEGELKDE